MREIRTYGSEGGGAYQPSLPLYLVRETNRLRAVLKSYYPQALELVGDLDTPMACDLIERWPSLDKIVRSRPSTLRAFYTQHRSRSKELMEQRLEIARTAVALTRDPAMIESGSIQATGLVRVVRALLESIAEVDQTIAERYQAHAEHKLIDSFPGAGAVIGPRLIALLSSDRERFESHEDLQRMTGVAPVTSRSGGRDGTISVHRRLKRSKFIHQTIVEWAGHTLKSSQWAREYYATKEATGASRFKILRSLGYKWLRILYHCWKTRVLYNEQTHQEGLIRRRSPLAARLLPAA
ncbi:MAG TPA: transposase [Thermoanaerobaculia bacterium]|nr:transposase [Thermoanaerobaculia bacterium]